MPNRIQQSGRKTGRNQQLIVEAINEALKRRQKSKAWLLRQLGYEPPFGSHYDLFKSKFNARLVERIFGILGIRLLVPAKKKRSSK